MNKRVRSTHTQPQNSIHATEMNGRNWVIQERSLINGSIPGWSTFSRLKSSKTCKIKASDWESVLKSRIYSYYKKVRAYTCCCSSRAPPADEDAPALQAGHCLTESYSRMLQMIVPHIGDETAPAARYSLLRSRSKQTSHANVLINKRCVGRSKGGSARRPAPSRFKRIWIFFDLTNVGFGSVRICTAPCFCGFPGFPGDGRAWASVCACVKVTTSRVRAGLPVLRWICFRIVALGYMCINVQICVYAVECGIAFWLNRYWNGLPDLQSGWNRLAVLPSVSS